MATDIWHGVVADIERNAINRDRIILREQIEAIPPMQSQLAFRQTVLELLKEITAPSDNSPEVVRAHDNPPEAGSGGAATSLGGSQT